MTLYVPRLTLDQAIAARLQAGTGTFALEGPPGAGKSTALLHALGAEAARRGPRGRGFVRLVQLFGDEPPSLCGRRLLREATHLHLCSYPQPEALRALVEAMAEVVPGLAAAGKLLAALVPDDLRPLPQVALDALREVGGQAINLPGAAGGPLVLGVDLLGGSVGSGLREFFIRLAEGLPETVVLLLAQPGGAASLVPLPAHDRRRVAVGALEPDEALAFLRQFAGADADDPGIAAALGTLSLLPGDLAQLVNLSPQLAHGGSLKSALSRLAGDLAGRYEERFLAGAGRPDDEWRAAAELCAQVAVRARPDAPLLAEDAARLLGPLEAAGLGVDLLRLRRHELAGALCVTATATSRGMGADAGFPLLPRHGQAAAGVRRALVRQGLLAHYQRRWLADLRRALAEDPDPRRGMRGGVRAFSLLLEMAAEAPAGEEGTRLLGEAVHLLGELEVPLWRSGWHRTFADLHDELAPRLTAAGIAPLHAAPGLWFRRARARVQGVEWSGQGAAEELPRALAELDRLALLAELPVLEAQAALGLSPRGDEVRRQCQRLPNKARQARGYARLLPALLPGGAPLDADEARLALDDTLAALSAFCAEAGEGENRAQSLTILADWYSADAQDEAALWHYRQALRAAGALAPVPAFCVGVIQRSLARHHARFGRQAEADAALQASRWSLLPYSKSSTSP